MCKYIYTLFPLLCHFHHISNEELYSTVFSNGFCKCIYLLLLWNFSLIDHLDLFSFKHILDINVSVFFGLFSTPHISSLWSTVTSIFPIDVKLFIDCENGTEQRCFVNITWCDVSCVILAPHSCELNLIYHVTHLNSTNLQKRQRERTFQLFNHSTTFKASISFVSVIHHNMILRIVYYFKVSAFIS